MRGQTVLVHDFVMQRRDLAPLCLLRVGIKKYSRKVINRTSEDIGENIIMRIRIQVCIGL